MLINKTASDRPNNERQDILLDKIGRDKSHVDL
jgi:hypothetical protein